MIDYDGNENVRLLERCLPQLRVAFACACAERLIPAYVVFDGRTGGAGAGILRSVMTELWRDLERGGMSEDDIEASLERCMALLPDEEEGAWIPERAPAEDAAAAVSYALRARSSGSSQEAAWAGARAYDAVDDYARRLMKVDPNAEGAEERILSHPVVQTELRRQKRDLEMLVGCTPDSLQDVLARLRDRAKAEIAIPLNDAN